LVRTLLFYRQIAIFPLGVGRRQAWYGCYRSSIETWLLSRGPGRPRASCSIITPWSPVD